MTVASPNAASFAVAQDRRLSTELRLLLQTYADAVNAQAALIEVLTSRLTEAEAAVTAVQVTADANTVAIADHESRIVALEP